MLRRWVRHRALEAARHTESTGDRAALVKLAVEAAIPPAGLLVWVWGVYAALRLLIMHLVAGAPNSPAIVALDWLRYVGNVAALFWLILRLISVVEVRLQGWAAGTANRWDDVLAVVVVRAVRLIIPLAGIILVLPALPVPSAYSGLFRQATSLGLVAAVGFILYELLNSGESAVLAQFRIDERDNLRARKVYTQVKVLKKIGVAVIMIFTFASMLMVFEPVRQLGASILASAGVVGIIVGFAAQRSLATVLAGLQIALTQPIRLDDVVIVEGEWGRIEEINLLFVVVRIWDLRRLVVPITYFIEKPFQNWTRASADLLGSVFLYTDYTVPLDALRQELDRVLEDSKLWDRKVKVLQVTDAKERTLEVRVLVSAADSSAAWDLRCQVREKLVGFLQRSFPQCLPRTRAEFMPMPKLTE